MKYSKIKNTEIAGVIGDRALKIYADKISEKGLWKDLTANQIKAVMELMKEQKAYGENEMFEELK